MKFRINSGEGYAMKQTRREFLKTASAAGAGLALFAAAPSLAEPQRERVRLGFIGVGLRGQDHLDLALRRDDVEVVALCDIQKVMMDKALEAVRASGRRMPEVILGGPTDYRKLLDRKDIDGVIIATPWEWHAPMSIDAMDAGKYVGCEVIAGTTLEECWDVVNASE